MRRSNTAWQPLETAQLDWSVNSTPRSTRFDDVYYSPAGGDEESQYVFLQGNKLPARWETHTWPEFCVVETGFGSGLNFLLTAQAWRRQSPHRPRLHYISIEKYPLTISDLARALDNWPALSDLAGQLLDNYPQPIPGQHRLVLELGGIILDLWWEDVTDVLPELAAAGHRLVDAWYLDGFAPSRNESMWNKPLYSAMGSASRPGATFATFTAAGDVRRGLQQAGFKVSKRTGFGHKRECLQGRLHRTCPGPRPQSTPWDTAANRRPVPSSALVIGAGLAGCTAAAALAQRGIEVTLLEQKQVACAGSGNNQGILYTRLSVRHSAATDFALQSYCFAYRFYRDLLQAGYLRPGVDGNLCGSIHQSTRQTEMATLAEALGSVPEFAQVIDADRASEILGLRQAVGGYWFPDSGWMRPPSVCRALIDRYDIRLLENTGRIELEPIEHGWRALTGDGPAAEADCAIIATGTAANQHGGLSWLPLQSIRGQTTDLPSNSDLAELRTGLCHTGYISPARAQQHCIGATFDLDDEEPQIRIEDHHRNLEALAIAVPSLRESLAKVDPGTLTGRVGHRCATPDYLPLVGAIPDYEAFLHSYGGLRRNAKQIIPTRGDYLPGLFLTTGHGSRGLTSTPLAAQILASQVCGEALPLSRELYRAVAPGRFIIRKLSRGQA